MVWEVDRGKCRLITCIYTQARFFRVDLNNVENAGLLCFCRPTDVDQVSTLTTPTPMHTVSLPSHYPPYIRAPQKTKKKKRFINYHTIAENV